MAERSVGTKLVIAPNAVSPATSTEVGGLTEINGLSLSADTLDSTNLSSTGGYREFKAGFKDAGEVSVSGYFDNTTGEGQAELYALFASGATSEYAIQFPTALNAQWVFDGVVTAIETGATLEDLVSFSATIKVSGQPTLEELD